MDLYKKEIEFIENDRENSTSKTDFPNLKLADDHLQMIMSTLSIIVITYTLIRAKAFHCKMTKEFTIILLLYLIVYITREIKQLTEA